MNETTINPEAEYGIKDVCKILELSEVYVRRMVLKGKIVSRKIEIRTNTYKHLITGQTLIDWRAGLQGHNKREDGRSKYTMYAKPEELAEIQALLDEKHNEAIIKRANEARINAEDAS